MKFAPHGVFVLWEWEWVEDMELFEPAIEPAIESQEDSGGSDPDSQDEAISTSQSDSEIPPSSIPTLTHTVTFKCIGATRSPESQITLKKVSELSTEGHEVPVNIFCEPENPVDSRAIAF